MKNNKAIITALSTGLVVFVSLFIGIIIKTNAQAEITLIMTYLLVSLILSGFSYLMAKTSVKYGPEILIVFSIIMGIYLYTAMPTGQDGLSQLAAGLGWLFGMAFITLVLIVYTLITLIKKKRN